MAKGSLIALTVISEMTIVNLEASKLALPPNAFHASGEHPEQPQPGQPLRYYQGTIGIAHATSAARVGGALDDFAVLPVRDTGLRQVVLLRLRQGMTTHAQPTITFLMATHAKETTDPS